MSVDYTGEAKSKGKIGRWIVSAHGIYEKENTHKIVIPEGVKIHFFTPVGDKDHRTILGISKSWTVYNALIAGKTTEAMKYVDKTYKPGCWVLNLVAVGTKDFPSGIYPVGSSTASRALKENEELTIADLLKEFQGEIFWVACT